MNLRQTSSYVHIKFLNCEKPYSNYFLSEICIFSNLKFSFGAFHNDCTALGGGGIKDFVTAVLSTKNKKRDDGERDVKNYLKNCVTSFMDNPFARRV